MSSADFYVRRDNLRQCRVLSEQTLTGLQEGQVRLRVEKFALTANNISYAAFGEVMAYWAYFPAPSGWGRIPAWGYAEVEQSRHPELGEGERVFGYLPMSTHVVVQPEKVGIVRFIDASPHRRKLPTAYQGYFRLGGDTYYDPALEDHQALLRPVFITAFLVEEFLSAQQLFGAKRVLISSASSKTALSLAHLFSYRDMTGVEIVGLTSPAHASFCEKVGLYGRVLAYDALAELPADVPTVYVDFAGNGRLLRQVHEHFGERLKYSCEVGGTHWEQRESQYSLPGARPAYFYAAAQFQKLSKQWSLPGLESRIQDRMHEFIASANPWLQIVQGRGPATVEKVYRQLLEGFVPPQQGHMLSLFPE